MTPANQPVATPERPIVTIVIPTYQRADLLEQALRSVAAQSWPAVEALVIDDAGDAATAGLVARIAQETGAGGKRFRTVMRPDLRPAAKGPQVCRNIGIRQAAGAFILFLDDDDLLAPDCLAGRIAHLLADPGLDFCVGQCRQFEDIPKPDDRLWMAWTADQDDLLLLLGNNVPWQTSGPLWRLASIRRIGDWNETLGAGHDYEMHVRALAMGLRYFRSDQTDYYWRLPRPDSFSGFERFKQLHASGAFIAAFDAAIRAVDANHSWTPARRAAAFREAFRLAVQCRLFGGNARTAQQGIAAARAANCGSWGSQIEATAVNQAWFRIAGKIPALAWVRWRGLAG